MARFANMRNVGTFIALDLPMSVRRSWNMARIVIKFITETTAMKPLARNATEPVAINSKATHVLQPMEITGSEVFTEIRAKISGRCLLRAAAMKRRVLVKQLELIVPKVQTQTMRGTRM